MGGVTRSLGGIKPAVAAVTALVALWPGSLAAGAASNQGVWFSTVPATNLQVSSPTSGGGYPQMPPVSYTHLTLPTKA